MLLLDIATPGLAGLAVACALAAAPESPPHRIRRACVARVRAAVDYLLKPVHGERLVAAIAKVARRADAEGIAALLAPARNESPQCCLAA